MTGRQLINAIQKYQLEDLDIFKEGYLMISEVEADKIDRWLRNFQKEHGNTMVVNDNIIRDLACALCDDIPLGYEASHRLANWLFCHLNV